MPLFIVWNGDNPITFLSQHSHARGIDYAEKHTMQVNHPRAVKIRYHAGSLIITATAVVINLLEKCEDHPGEKSCMIYVLMGLFRHVQWRD
jgi:hypothetical protein